MTTPVTRGAPDLEQLLDEMGRALHEAWREGVYDPGRDVWEQEIPELEAAWDRLTHPANTAALQSRLRTASSADRNRLLHEAYRWARSRADRRAE